MKPNKMCQVCRKEFVVKAHRQAKAKYCSSICFGFSRRGIKWGKQIEKTCLSCGKAFLIYPYRISSAQYCSRKCTYKEHGQKVAGEKSHLWKGGISKIGQNARMTTEYKKWRMAVFQRDNFTCQMCFIVGKNLQANHIKKWSLYPELRFSIDNGITLCKGCHKKITRHEDFWEMHFRFIVGTWEEVYASAS